MFPKVVQLIPYRDCKVDVYFEDGKIVSYDMVPKIEKEAFQTLKDIKAFIDTCTVLNDTLAWDISKNRDNTSCFYTDPDTLYELSNVKERVAQFYIQESVDMYRIIQVTKM